MNQPQHQPEYQAAHYSRPRLHLDQDLQILARHDHAQTGARLILAHHAAHGYAVFWAAPWQKTIRDYALFKTRRNARAAFRRRAAKAPPVTPALCRDFQVSRVYNWEERRIDRYCPDNLTIAQMRRITAKIATDFNIAAPDLRYQKPRHDCKYPTSYYDIERNSIKMRHRTLSCTIHEMAHAIEIKRNGNDWAHHGPGFVRTLIDMAAIYQYWLSREELEKSARKAGLLVAPRRDNDSAEAGATACPVPHPEPRRPKHPRP